MWPQRPLHSKGAQQRCVVLYFFLPAQESSVNTIDIKIWKGPSRPGEVYVARSWPWVQSSHVPVGKLTHTLSGKPGEEAVLCPQCVSDVWPWPPATAPCRRQPPELRCAVQGRRVSVSLGSLEFMRNVVYFQSIFLDSHPLEGWARGISFPAIWERVVLNFALSQRVKLEMGPA